MPCGGDGSVCTPHAWGAERRLSLKGTLVVCSGDVRDWETRHRADFLQPIVCSHRKRTR